MVEVNRSNYTQLIPEICDKINKSSFISIDCEYTGINAQDSLFERSLFDDASARYKKIKEIMKPFVISQLGLSIFKKDWEVNNYTVESYNIYLYPLVFDDFGKRDQISLQVSSASFLACNNFDFNKFIRDGCPYLNKKREAELKEFLEQNRYFMKAPTEKIDERYFPRAIYKFENDDIQEAIDRLKGVSAVIEALIRARKALIGHNMIVDLILLYRHFIDELPDNYEDFKERLHLFFPDIIDTKCLATGLRRKMATENLCNDFLSDASLFALYKSIFNIERIHAPKIILDGETGHYQSTLDFGKGTHLENSQSDSVQNFAHEAAFDSLVTGCVFVKLTFIITRFIYRYEPFKIAEMTQIELLDSIRIYCNQIQLGRAAIPYINLNGKDPISNKPKILKVTSKTGIDLRELRRLIMKYGDVDFEIMNKYTVLIAAPGFSMWRDINRKLKQHGYQVSEYNPKLIFFWKCLLITTGGISGAVLMSYMVSKFLNRP